MQKSKISGTQILAIALFLGACVLGVMAQRPNLNQFEIPRAQWNDATPLGGKGLRLLLERLDYKVQLATSPIGTMPKDARVWLLLDPTAGFSKREVKLLLEWVQKGGTLVWALPISVEALIGGNPTGILDYMAGRAGIDHMRKTLKIAEPKGIPAFLQPHDEPLPPLGVLKRSGASIYWNGVGKATGSGSTLETKMPYLEIAGSTVGPQLARVDYGKGHIFLIPDALLFTNYALSKPDNAVLVTNIVRAHMPDTTSAGATPEYSGAVYFDERQHGEPSEPQAPKPSLLYYLGRPPLRYAILQLLGAALLLWALYGRRLGAPVPLPEQEPVTRASNFAAAMGSLFQKVHRPRVAGVITGEEFRRRLTQRIGMSLSDSDAEIAARAAEMTGLPAAMIDRLLLQAKAPAEHEADVLSAVQEMEIVLRSLNSH